MNFKFSVKQLIIILIIACAITAPRYPRYLKQNTQTQIRISIIFAISLIIAGAGIVWLVYDYLKNEREEYEEKEDKQFNGTNNKFKSSKNDFNNCYEKVSINDKIALIQRLRELKCGKFEEVVEMLFKFQGYKIENGPSYSGDIPQADGGKDLIVSKNGEIYNVQIKKYYTDPVKLIDVTSFKGVIGEEKGYFVTTSVFSYKAKKFADGHGIDCVEYNNLLCVISKLSDNNKKILQNFINDENNIEIGIHPRTCKKCGAPMNYRKGGYGCLRYNYPKPNEKKCNCREFYK